jgi:hypothetical protein
MIRVKLMGLEARQTHVCLDSSAHKLKTSDGTRGLVRDMFVLSHVVFDCPQPSAIFFLISYNIVLELVFHQRNGDSWPEEWETSSTRVWLRDGLGNDMILGPQHDGK